MKLTALDILRMEFGDSANSMTPTILSQELLSANVAAELSEGTAASGQAIFGVSVVAVRPSGGAHCIGGNPDEAVRSAVFPTRAAAEAHILAMRDHLSSEGQSGTPATGAAVRTEDGEPKATSLSWKTKPFPFHRARLKLDRSFDAAEWSALLRGVIPEEMEDKWFIYEAGGWLNFHRSWTGYCNYRVHLLKTTEGGGIAEAWVSREKEQYSSVDDDHDARLLSWLIDVLLLKRPAAYPGSGLAKGLEPLAQWSSVGRAMLVHDADGSVAARLDAAIRGDDKAPAG
jgi:hypothetical protein